MAEDAARPSDHPTQATPASLDSANQFLRLAAHILGAPIALLLEEGGQEARVAAAYGMDEAGLPPRFKQFISQVIASREPVVVEDARAAGIDISSPRIGAYVAHPLPMGSHPPRWVLVISKRGRAWRADDLQALADLVGLGHGQRHALPETQPLDRDTGSVSVQEHQRVEAALREAEKRFEILSQLTSDYSYCVRLDDGGVFTPEWVTDTIEKITGYSAEEVNARGGWSILVYPDDIPVAYHRMQELLANRENVAEYRIMDKDGGVRWLRDVGRPEWDPAEARVVRIFGAAKDITQDRQVESELREAAKRFQSLFESANDAIIITDHETNIVGWNIAAEQIFGYSDQEAIGQSIVLVIPEEDRSKHLAGMERLKRDASYVMPHLDKTVELTGRHRDGSRFPIEIALTSWDTGSQRFYSAMIRDITRRKQAEAEQQRLAALLHAGVEIATQINRLLDPVMLPALVASLLQQHLGFQQVDILLTGERDEALHWAACAPAGHDADDAFHSHLAAYMATREPTAPIAITIEQLLDEFPALAAALHPQAQTLCILPLMAQGQQLGIIGLQDWRAESFSEAALALLGTLGSQIVVAIQSARLFQTEQLLKLAVASSIDGIVITDATQPDNPIIYANPSFETITGYSLAEILGHNCRFLNGPERQQPELDKLRRAIARGEKCEVLLRNYRKDGSLFWNELSVYPLLNASGRPTHFVGVQRDVSERFHAERELRTSMLRYRAVVEDQTELIIRTLPAGTVTFVNQTFCRFFNLTADQLLGRSFLTMISPEAQGQALRRLEFLSPTNAVSVHEESFALEAGVRWLRWTVRGLFDEQGQLIEVQSVGREITEQKVAEAGLLQQALVFENILDSVILTDMYGRIIDCNQATNRLFGYSRDELLGQAPSIWHHPDDRGTLTAQLRSGLERDGRWQGEIRFVRKDGQEGYCEVVTVPLLDKAGHRLGSIGVSHDITERRRAEEQLRRAEQRYRQLFEEAPAMYVLTQSQGGEPIIQDCNQLFARTLGYNRTEVIGRNIGEFYTEASRQALKHDYPVSLRQPMLDLERELVTRDGSRIQTLLRAMPEVMDEGIAYGTRAMFVDISERKRIEEALRRSEQEYRGLFENAHDALIIFEPETERVLDVNERACELYGYPRAEFIGLSLETLSTDVLMGKDRIGRILSDQGYLHFETVQRRRDGSEMQIEINAAQVSYGAQPAILSINRDITDRTRAEQALRRYNERLRFLNMIGRAILAARSTTDIAQVALEQLQSLVNCQQAALFSFDETTGEATLIASRGVQTLPLAVGTHLPLKHLSLPPALNGSPAMNREASAHGDREAITVHLMAQNELRGVLCLWGAPDAPLSTDHIEIAGEVADQLAVAFQNARLYEAEQQARLVAETLRSANAAVTQTLKLDTILATLLEYLGRLVPYDRATVMLTEEPDAMRIQATRTATPDLSPITDGEVLTIAESPLIAQLVREQRGLIINDAAALGELPWSSPEQPMASWMGIPLVADGTIIGLYSMESLGPLPFTATDLQRAETLAAQAAVAIQNASLFAKVTESGERLQALSRRLVEVQEEERRYVARELHDQVGQLLTGLKLLLDLSTRPNVPPNPTRLAEAKQLVDELITHVRDLSLNLRPAMLDDLGLYPALAWLFERYTSQTGISINLARCELPSRLQPELATVTYRIVQEALTNAARYAEVQQVTVQLWTERGVLSIHVEDKGKGFDMNRRRREHTSNGVAGMEERAKLMGGLFEIVSKPGKGTRILARLPLVDSLTLEQLA